MSTKIDITGMFPELPHYLTIYKVLTEASCEHSSFVGEGDSVGVEVHSTIHENKVVTLPTSCSEGYVNRYPNQWKAETLGAIVRRYGLKPQPLRYS